MKKIFLLLALLSLFASAFAQVSDGTIKTNTNNLIRNASTVTRANHSLINDQIVDAKMSRVEQYATTGTNTYSVSVPWVTSYTFGLHVLVQFQNANTGASTININSLGTKSLVKSVSTALASGDIFAGQVHHLWYDGTNFQVLTIGGSGGGGFSDPMTTRGDIIYRNSSNTTARLGRGTANQVLTSDGTDISWAAPSGGGASTFTSLTDAPSSYTSQAKKGVRVNGTPNGLEFYTITPNRTITSAGAIVQTDENGTVVFNSATPFNFTIDQLTQGTIVNLLNKGSATVTLVAGSGVTITGATTLTGGSNYSAVVFYDTQTNPIITTSQINVNLATDVSGVLPVANGGTNKSSLGTALQVLRTNAGATDTEWATISGGSPAASLLEAQTGTDSTKGMTPLRTRQITRKVYNVEAYGAVHDGVYIYSTKIGSSTGVNTTNGSTSLASGSNVFTAAMVGKTILIAGAGTSGATLKTTVASFTSPSLITLSVAASTTVNGTIAFIGTDDTSAIQAAINDCNTKGGGTVYFPNGIYMINGALQTSVSGTNPNSQLYIPSTAVTATTIGNTIELVGESVPEIPISFGGITLSGVQLISTLITSSGTNPSVIGTIGAIGNYLNYNYSDIKLENICVKVWTNNGNSIPVVSGYNLVYAAKINAYKISGLTDLGIQHTVNPSGSGRFGAWFSGLNNNGINLLKECWFSGWEYGAIIGEHTISEGIYVFGSYHGFVILRSGHSIRGQYLTHQVVNQILIPSASTFLGQPNSTNNALVDFYLETEDNSTDPNWYATQTLLNDSGNYGIGEIVVEASNSTAYDFLYGTMVTGGLIGFKLNVRPWNSAIPKVTRTGGMPLTAAPLTALTNPAVFEIGSATVAANGLDNTSLLVQTTNQPATATGLVGSRYIVNSAVSTSEKRFYIDHVVTNGATNIAQGIEYLLNGTTLVNTLEKNPSSTGYRYFVPIDINGGAGALKLSGSAGTSGQVLTSQGSGSAPIWSTPASLIRSIINTQTIATDANITASPGVSYFAAANLFTANRTIDVSALNTDNDYMEIYLDTQTSNLSFTGASVYLNDNTTTVSNLSVKTHYQIRRKNGRLYIIN